MLTCAIWIFYLLRLLRNSITLSAALSAEAYTVSHSHNQRCSELYLGIPLNAFSRVLGECQEGCVSLRGSKSEGNKKGLACKQVWPRIGSEPCLKHTKTVTRCMEAKQMDMKQMYCPSDAIKKDGETSPDIPMGVAQGNRIGLSGAITTCGRQASFATRSSSSSEHPRKCQYP